MITQKQNSLTWIADEVLNVFTGREEGQLWYPRKVAVIRHSGKYVVCDRGNERSRMQIFTKNGHFIKKIAIRYIDIVAGLAITSAGRYYLGLHK